MARLASLLAAAILSLGLPAAHAARQFPPFVTLPDLPIDKRAVDTDDHGRSEFVLRDKTEVHRGKVWLGYLEYRGRWGEDRRAALGAIVDALKKGGWEVMMIDEPRQPPLATLKLTTKDNRVAWASVEMFDTARVLVLEPSDD
jgi:hypothetical protein